MAEEIDPQPPRPGAPPRVVQSRLVDVEPPKKFVPTEPLLWGYLELLPVGPKALDVNFSIQHTRELITRYRKRHGKDFRFVVRPLSPGITRIWRIQ